MKKIFTAFASALTGLCAFASFETLDITGGDVATETVKVVGIRVVSSVATGTVQVKSVSTLPVVENVAHVSATTNFTYTYIYTNATATVTNTTSYLPLPLGPTVTSYVTNSVVTLSTNFVPTATSTVVVTNAIGSAITCAGGVGSDSPTNTFIIPGEPVFYSGTAKGKVLLIVER